MRNLNLVKILLKNRFLYKNQFKYSTYKTSNSLFSTSTDRIKKIPDDNLELKDFLVVGKNLKKPNEIVDEELIPPYLQNLDLNGHNRKVYFETYGCQMNSNDTEISWSILKSNGYLKTNEIKEADVILIFTCSVREGAEQKIWNRLVHLKPLKNRSKKLGPLQIGILGCMAERLKTQILEKEKFIDVIAGPDSYKDLPRLLALTKHNSRTSAINVILSLDETYADVMPVRLDENKVTAFVSIMRGCDNMCTYCIVPFTRGKERSRSIKSIEMEIEHLTKDGIKEVTLLGQNVNSYRDKSESGSSKEIEIVSGFKTVYKPKMGGLRFHELLERIANVSPETRIRYTSPHPKDFPIEVLETIKKYPNICKSIHLPAQSGNSEVLERMRRGYTREAYINLVKEIKEILPEVSLSSDFICGFCDETEEEFQDTLTLIDQVKYNVAYLFPYSMREKTTAFRRFKDNVPHQTKIDRLKRMVEMFRKNAELLNTKLIGSHQLILVEGESKKSSEEMFGRNDGNIKVIIPNKVNSQPIRVGDYVAVEVTDANSQVLKGLPLEKIGLMDFYRQLTFSKVEEKIVN